MCSLVFDAAVWEELRKLSQRDDVSIAHLIRAFVKEGIDRTKSTKK